MVSTSRIDVVSVDSARGDTATSGMVALRRELAKLNAQAAAVEKSLDDQRRERSESLERAEKAQQQAHAMEARIAAAEAETLAQRKAHELVIAEMRASQEASMSELRKARDERAASERAADSVKATLAEALAKTARGEGATKAAQDEAAKRTAEVTKLSEELARVKEEHARDRTTARERIAVLERTTEETAAQTQRLQSELDAARHNELRLAGELQAAKEKAELFAARIEASRETDERLQRQLEAALARAAEAESQALTISLSHASLEGSLRTLRDEVTEAFARVGSQAAAAAAVSSSRMLPITPDLVEASPSVKPPPSAQAGSPEARASAPPSGIKTAQPPAFEAPDDAKRSTPPPPSYQPNRSPE